jgi:hypothetical protein
LRTTAPPIAPFMTTVREYVRYANSIEVRQPNEEEILREILASFGRLQRYTFEKHRHGIRGAHAKSHGVLKGELTVYDGLPEPLAQGVFRSPRTFPAIVRLSTTAGDILPDGVASFRGMAVKIVGVEGPKLLPELADAVTQDFLFVNHPAFPTGDAASFLKALRRIVKMAHLPAPMQKLLTTLSRAGRTVLGKVGIDVAGVIGQAMPETHILGETYFTGAAMRYGDYVAQLSVVPVSTSLQPLRGKTIDTGNDAALRDAVVEFFRHQSAEYEIRVQLCTNLERMPVEDASVRWPEEESPYQPIARLTLPAQDADSAARRVYADDVLSFSPWHGLAEHRPLGSIMRVRREAYEASSRARHARNAQPRAEPGSIAELPD